MAGPTLGRGTLLALARLQDTRCGDFTDEEPGKILHEFRSGKLTRTGVKPYNPNYGTADATELCLILLSKYWRWTRDDDMARHLRGNALAGLRWIDMYGDHDGDGYVEYANRSPEGLGNQCWRDSPDGVCFSDGKIPFLPINTCDLQGYTYDAKMRLAKLRTDRWTIWPSPRGSAQMPPPCFNGPTATFGSRNAAATTRWASTVTRTGSKTSNMGRLLWSGIVPADRAEQVVRQLMSPDMFSGWGIRTLSRKERRHNALGYHLGTGMAARLLDRRDRHGLVRLPG